MRLSLVNYNWVHTTGSYHELWDFSNLRYLNLSMVDFNKFLTSMPPGDLSNLETLSISGHIGRSWPFNNIERAQGPFRDLFQRLKCLRELRVRSQQWQEFLPPDSICELGSSLEKPSLEDFTLSPNRVLIRPLSLNHLSSIRVACPKLEFIGADLPTEG